MRIFNIARQFQVPFDLIDELFSVVTCFCQDAPEAVDGDVVELPRLYRQIGTDISVGMTDVKPLICPYRGQRIDQAIFPQRTVKCADTAFTLSCCFLQTARKES